MTGRTTSPEAFLHLGALLLVPALAIGIALLRSRDDAEESFLLVNVFPALGILLAVVTKRPVLGLGVAFLLAVLRLLPAAEGRAAVRLSPGGGGRGASRPAGARRRP